MRVVQALHWLKDTLATDRQRILSKLTKVLADPVHGDAIRKDLVQGFAMLPTWIQSLVRELPGCDPKTATPKRPRKPKELPSETARRKRSGRPLER